MKDYKNIICAFIIATAIIAAALIIGSAIQNAGTDIVHGIINQGLW